MAGAGEGVGLGGGWGGDWVGRGSLTYTYRRNVVDSGWSFCVLRYDGSFVPNDCIILDINIS